MSNKIHLLKWEAKPFLTFTGVWKMFDLARLLQLLSRMSTGKLEVAYHAEIA